MNNSPLEKNRMAEPGFESGTYSLIYNDGITESCGRHLYSKVYLLVSADKIRTEVSEVIISTREFQMYFPLQYFNRIRNK